MDKILFVKYSNDRANRFAICTEIFANGDKKLLKKRATTESAREHIKNIASMILRNGSAFLAAQSIMILFTLWTFTKLTRSPVRMEEFLL